MGLGNIGMTGETFQGMLPLNNYKAPKYSSYVLNISKSYSG